MGLFPVEITNRGEMLLMSELCGNHLSPRAQAALWWKLILVVWGYDLGKSTSAPFITSIFHILMYNPWSTQIEHRALHSMKILKTWLGQVLKTIKSIILLSSFNLEMYFNDGNYLDGFIKTNKSFLFCYLWPDINTNSSVSMVKK